MMHGTTIHGLQCLSPPSRRSEPLAYFHRDGPIGDLFRFVKAKGCKQRIAVLGMGAGTLAAYAEPGWEMTFYEIDKEVIKLAYDETYFTYLKDAQERGVKIDCVLGDGRLQIQKAPVESYDLIFMDAFSSDSVPTHLLTKEALAMYRTKLAPGGLIIVNIANRFLIFEAVMGNLADALGMSSLIGVDNCTSPTRYLTAWVVLARADRDFGTLNELKDLQSLSSLKGGMTIMDFDVVFDVGTSQRWPCWQELPRDPRLGVWTDDYTNVFRVFRWK